MHIYYQYEINLVYIKLPLLFIKFFFFSRNETRRNKGKNSLKYPLLFSIPFFQ